MAEEKSNVPHQLLDLGDDVTGIEIDKWRITAKDSKIMSSNQIEQYMKNKNRYEKHEFRIEKEHKLRAIPEMIFNDWILLQYKKNENEVIEINLNPVSALCSSDPKGAANLKVKHSKQWNKSVKKDQPNHEVKIQVLENYDWTFTPRYSGELKRLNPQNNNNQNSTPVDVTDSNDTFKMELLTRKDPVLFFKSMTFFEDDLGDNGISQLTVKMRVMPTCLFILMRFWLRIDGVLFRMHENRFFHEFGTSVLLREIQVKESDWNTIHGKTGADHLKYTDPDFVSTILKVKGKVMHRITF